MTSDLCYVLTPKNPKKVNLKYYYAYFNSRRKDIVRRLARGTNKKACLGGDKERDLFERPSRTLKTEYTSIRYVG